VEDDWLGNLISNLKTRQNQGRHYYNYSYISL